MVGFSTYSGTVIAAREWGAKMEIMDIPKAREGSWDNLLHFIDGNNKNSNEMGKDKLILFPHNNSTDRIILESKYNDNNSDQENYENKGQRAIGVVYNSTYERYGNYVPTILSLRYDVLLFIYKTSALSPLHMQQPIKNKDFPETFPTGI